MNTCSGREKLRKSQILLDSGSSSTIMMGKLASKIKPIPAPETTWETQARKFMTSQKVNVHFCLTYFSTTKIMSWKCHVNSSTNIRYDMILGRDLRNALGLDIKFSENIIMGGDVTYEGFLTPMIDVSNYDFKPLPEKIVKPEKYFINSYFNKCLEFEGTIRSTRRIRSILDAKCKKSELT